jgi:hypothetical protein
MNKSNQDITQVNGIKTVQVDHWEHPDISKRILNYINECRAKRESSRKDAINNGNTFLAVPNMKKPYFWQFNKIKKYRLECDRIFNEYKIFHDRSYPQ